MWPCTLGTKKTSKRSRLPCRPWAAALETFCVDVLDKKAVDESVKAGLEAFGHVDILVNNAGVNVRKPVLELTPEEWDLVIDTNLKGYFLMAQAVVPAMLARGRAR